MLEMPRQSLMSVFKINQHGGKSHLRMLVKTLISGSNPYPLNLSFGRRNLEFVYLIGKIRTTKDSNGINFILLAVSLCLNWQTLVWAKLIGSLGDRCLF